MNLTIVTGTVTKEAEVFQSKFGNSTPQIQFRVKPDRDYTSDDKEDSLNAPQVQVRCWGSRWLKFLPKLGVGARVFVSGEMRCKKIQRENVPEAYYYYYIFARRIDVFDSSQNKKVEKESQEILDAIEDDENDIPF